MMRADAPERGQAAAQEECQRRYALNEPQKLSNFFEGVMRPCDSNVLKIIDFR